MSGPTVDSDPVSLVRVRLNSDGYARNRRYFGQGMPLYHALCEDGELFIRAYSRDEAKEKVLKEWPEARFYR